MASDPARWAVERLARRHDRTAFSCGNAALDDWLRLRAGQYQRKDLARAYVAVLPGEAAVRGYYALSAHRVRYDALPQEQAKGLPKIDVPVVLLGRLAVDRAEQGRGLGSFLLVDALARVHHLSEAVGVRAVKVDATNDAAHGFYRRFGFTALSDDPNHLFLPIHVIGQLGLPPPATGQ